MRHTRPISSCMRCPVAAATAHGHLHISRLGGARVFHTSLFSTSTRQLFAHGHRRISPRNCAAAAAESTPFQKQRQRRHSSHAAVSDDKKKSPGGTPPPPRRRYGVYAALLAALILGHGYVSDATGLSDVLQTWLYGRALNEQSFVPFVVLSNEPVSPSSPSSETYLLTVAPRHRTSESALATRRRLHAPSGAPLGWSTSSSFPFFQLQIHLPHFLLTPHAHAGPLTRAWRHGCWSVEIKQPQLQVARAYTPLPAPLDNDERELESGVLRFLVRRVTGGEVSTYLSHLRAGDTVELRGPHPGFDVRARLGDVGTEVAFLAAGTGIAPALQVARAVLRDDEKSERGREGERVRVCMRVLWATRLADDCAGLSGTTATTATTATAVNPIVTQLMQMQARHGSDRLAVSCSVDVGGKCSVGPAAIEALVGSGMSGTSSKNRIHTSTPLSSTACTYHSQAVTAHLPEHDPETAGEGGSLVCPCRDRDLAGPGKNLLLVSGPEGFVGAFAGQKTWDRGLELQGPVGGVVGALRKKRPDLWADWLVLKL